LFGFLKKQLASKRFDNDNVLNQVIMNILTTIPKSEWRKTFLKWQERLQKCVDFKGDYFEGIY
jgi:hypothetical protein